MFALVGKPRIKGLLRSDFGQGMPKIVSFSESGYAIEALHPPMLDAFSDYVVPLQPSKDALLEILTSRGFDPKASFVALEDGEVAAFWGVGARARKRYLIMSGTRIAHQGKGLASSLGRASIAAAKAAGCESFTLEVIAGNDKALGLYRKLGFEVARTVNCYRLNHPSPDGSRCEKTDFDTARRAFKKHSKWMPTWQNADETISALELTCFLHPEGAVVASKGGLVHQIAAATQTALTDLLAAAATLGPLTFVNIEASDTELNTLLEGLGAEKFVEQSEMCAPL